MTNEIKSPIEALSEVRAKFDAKLAEIRKIIASGKEVTLKVIEELKSFEREYASSSMHSEFMRIKKLDDPKVALIRQLVYPTIGHSFEYKEEEETKIKRIVGIDATSSSRQFDLLKFCKAATLDEMWQYDVSALNQTLCLWVASELGMSNSRIEGIFEDYQISPEAKMRLNVLEVSKTSFMKKKAKELLKGGTPFSKNALCKLLQKIIDSILPSDEDGKSRFKCNNYDVAFLLACYSKKSQKALQVKVSNDSYLRTLIMLILYRIITKGEYDVEYRKIRSKTSDESKKTEKSKTDKNPELPTIDMEHDNEVFEGTIDVGTLSLDAEIDG